MMRKILKKGVASAFTASLVLAVLGCSQQQTGQPAAAAGEKDDTPVTYSFFMNVAAPEYPQDGGEARKLITEAAAKAGIKGFDYKVSLNSGKDFFTKLNIEAASGELPDYFDVDIPTLTKFVDEGLVLPLDDYIKKSPSITSLVPKEAWDAVTFNGKIYGIPSGSRPEPFNQPSSTGVLYRADWLKNLGLKVPTTLEEYHQVLTAFTKNDPDKNGKNDTYGLGGKKDSIFEGVFGAFGVFPEFWYERDGQLKQGYVLPETKQALAVLQQWYKEGLIDPEFAVADAQQLDSKVINGKVGVYEGPAFAIFEKNKITKSLKEVTPGGSLGFTAPPTGPKGESGLPETPPASSISAISAKVKQPNKLFAYLNWSLTDGDNGGYLLREGVEGKHYTFDKEKNDLQDLVGASEKYKDGFSNPIKFIAVTDRRWAPDYVRKALEDSAKFARPNALWKTVQAELDYPDLKDKLWPEYYTKIVTGVWSVDKWDEFVKKYYEQGGKEIEEQGNEAWKSLNK
uniref:extracellular solute-binding protein n=1 Tax=Paenibacillus terrae TaxID=159743 RepID=UPI0011A89AD4|nr:extracellular solute-binding protein [Paenibacillus terrae]